MREYLTFDFPGAMTGSQTFLTSIRNYKCKFIITGYMDYPSSAALVPASFVYFGNLKGKGKFLILDYPSATGAIVSGTNPYSSDVTCSGNLNVVGSYFLNTNTIAPLGFFYSGNFNGTGTWTPISPTSLSTTINTTVCTSIMGDIIVGNYSTPGIQYNSFLYNIKTKTYYGITMVGASAITANGVWQIKNHTYIVCGSFTNTSGLVSGYIVIFNTKTNTFSNWTQYNYFNDPTTNVVTVFNAIWGCKCYLNLVGYYNTNGGTAQPFLCTIKLNKCGIISQGAAWQQLTYANTSNLTATGVASDIIVGGYNLTTDLTTLHGYVSG